jgi:hypothetical protein
MTSEITRRVPRPDGEGNLFVWTIQCTIFTLTIPTGDECDVAARRWESARMTYGPPHNYYDTLMKLMLAGF